MPFFKSLFPFCFLSLEPKEGPSQGWAPPGVTACPQRPRAAGWGRGPHRHLPLADGTKNSTQSPKS